MVEFEVKSEKLMIWPDTQKKKTFPATVTGNFGSTEHTLNYIEGSRFTPIRELYNTQLEFSYLYMDSNGVDIYESPVKLEKNKTFQIQKIN
jgi:hypothetical protein